MQLYIDKTITFRINIFRQPQTTVTPTDTCFRRGESQFKREGYRPDLINSGVTRIFIAAGENAGGV